MEHIKTFESFVNEGMKHNPKPFDQIKPGDTAHTIGDNNSWEVLVTGYGKDYDSKLKKYDESGTVRDIKRRPSNYGMEQEDFEESRFIAVKRGSNIRVFTYDEGVIWVNK